MPFLTLMIIYLNLALKQNYILIRQRDALLYRMSLYRESYSLTGWAVALTCYISHSAKHRKTADFDPQRAKTPEAILMKLGMVDYVRDPTSRDNFGGDSAT